MDWTLILFALAFFILGVWGGIALTYYALRHYVMESQHSTKQEARR